MELKPEGMSTLQSFDSDLCKDMRSSFRLRDKKTPIDSAKENVQTKAPGSQGFLQIIPHSFISLSISIFFSCHIKFIITVLYSKPNKLHWSFGKHLKCKLYIKNWIGLCQNLLFGSAYSRTIENYNYAGCGFVETNYVNLFYHQRQHPQH